MLPRLTRVWMASRCRTSAGVENRSMRFRALICGRVSEDVPTVEDTDKADDTNGDAGHNRVRRGAQPAMGLSCVIRREDCIRVVRPFAKHRWTGAVSSYTPAASPPVHSVCALPVSSRHNLAARASARCDRPWTPLTLHRHPNCATG